MAVWPPKTPTFLFDCRMEPTSSSSCVNCKKFATVQPIIDDDVFRARVDPSAPDNVSFRKEIDRGVILDGHDLEGWSAALRSGGGRAAKLAATEAIGFTSPCARQDVFVSERRGGEEQRCARVLGLRSTVRIHRVHRYRNIGGHERSVTHPGVRYDRIPVQNRRGVVRAWSVRGGDDPFLFREEDDRTGAGRRGPSSFV